MKIFKNLQRCFKSHCRLEEQLRSQTPSKPKPFDLDFRPTAVPTLKEDVDPMPGGPQERTDRTWACYVGSKNGGFLKARTQF